MRKSWNLLLLISYGLLNKGFEMKPCANYQERVQEWHNILDYCLIQNDEELIKTTLKKEFEGYHAEFCGFIGFASLELKDAVVQARVSRDTFTTFWVAMTMVGMILGRDNALSFADTVFHGVAEGG